MPSVDLKSIEEEISKAKKRDILNETGEASFEQAYLFLKHPEGQGDLNKGFMQNVYPFFSRLDSGLADAMSETLGGKADLPAQKAYLMEISEAFELGLGVDNPLMSRITTYLECQSNMDLRTKINLFANYLGLERDADFIKMIAGNFENELDKDKAQFHNNLSEKEKHKLKQLLELIQDPTRRQTILNRIEANWLSDLDVKDMKHVVEPAEIAASTTGEKPTKPVQQPITESQTARERIALTTQSQAQPVKMPFTLRTDTKISARESVFTGEGHLSKTACSEQLKRVQERYLGQREPKIPSSVTTSVTPATKGNIESLVVHVTHENHKEDIKHALDKEQRYTVTLSTSPSDAVIRLVVEDIQHGITPSLTLNPGGDLLMALKFYECAKAKGLSDHNILHESDLNRLEEDTSPIGNHYRHIKAFTSEQLHTLDSSEPDRSLGASFKGKISLTSPSSNRSA